MVENDFAEAFVHKRRSFGQRFLDFCWSLVTGHRSLPLSAHTVCGVRLRAFSRWHAANLDFIESPFSVFALAYPDDREKLLKLLIAQSVAEPARVFGLLWLALRCCRLRYPQTINAYPSHPRNPRLKSALRKFLKNPALELKRFEAYFLDYCTRPELIHGEDSRPVSTPWYLYEVALARSSGLVAHNREAWNAPLASLSWDLIAHLEATGAKIDIVTAEDREAEKRQIEFGNQESRK